MRMYVVAILQDDHCLLGTSLDEDAALTLFAVASEDPACWEDIVAYWPRYRTPPVSQFADGLPMQAADMAAVRAAIGQHERWIVVDLIQKRLITGQGFPPIGRDQAFDMIADDSDGQHLPVSIHLPPWWELNEHCAPRVVDDPRENALSVPRVDRQVLFGDPLVEDLAARILRVVVSDPWRSSGAHENESARYDFTVAVHRDWLMTPREDLGGLFPRQMLHGGREWIDRLAQSQEMRFTDGGEIVAVPTDVSGYDEAPMGREEMVMYFDLCRELIGKGWRWCVEHGPPSLDTTDSRVQQRLLMDYLSDVKQRWLNDSFEGGSPPRFAIECCRRRVPRVAGVPIAGMTEREAEQHVIDCDCPLCNMMADGMLGPVFLGFDGHHLELDDEFAFSMCETREEWELEQGQFAEMSAAIEQDRTQREENRAQPNEFSSAWSGVVSDAPLPGDPQGHLKLAFLLAEVVGVLQTTGAPQEDINQLNDCFTDFRCCERADLPAAGNHLATHLEKLASRNPDLVGRVADLQSRIDEQIRLN